MTKRGSTFKDLKESKELGSLYKASRELHSAPKGGHTNLLREAEEERLAEAAWTKEELEELLADLDEFGSTWPDGDENAS